MGVTVITKAEATEFIDLVGIGRIEISEELFDSLKIISDGDGDEGVLSADLDDEYSKLLDTLEEVLAVILEDQGTLKEIEEFIQSDVEKRKLVGTYSYFVLDNRNIKRASKEDLSDRLTTFDRTNSFSEKINDHSETEDIDVLLSVDEMGKWMLGVRVTWSDTENDWIKTDVSLEGKEKVRSCLKKVLSAPIDWEKVLWYNDDGVDYKVIRHALFEPELSQQLEGDQSDLGVELANFMATHDEKWEEYLLNKINGNPERKLEIRRAYKSRSQGKIKKYLHAKVNQGFEIRPLLYPGGPEDEEVSGSVYDWDDEILEKITDFCRNQNDKGVDLSDLLSGEHVSVEICGNVLAIGKYEITISFTSVGKTVHTQLYLDDQSMYDFVSQICDTDFELTNSIIFR